jgi:Domain of unknown function (DUF4340)
MKLRGLTIATLILAGLAVGMYFSNKHEAAKVTKPPDDAPPKMLSVSDADIQKIEIKKKGGEDLVLQKNGAGKWEIVSPEAGRADQDAVSQLVSSVATVNADRVVEDKASGLSQYGLEPPVTEVTLTTKDGKTRRLLLGDDAPTSGGAYAKVDGDARVFTVASYTKTGFDKSAKDLRDKRLLTFDQDKASRIELASKKQTIEFGRDKDQWQILKPGPYRADGLQVEELVRKLREAKMDAAVSDDDAKKAATAFASGTPVATVKVTDNTGTQELQVRKSNDDYYAKSSVVDGFHKVPTDLGTGLDKSADDFRNKKLFDFGFTDPNKVELKEGAKFYGFTKGGEEWWSNGKKMDNTSVQNFLDKLRDVSASKFVDSGFAAPTAELTVTSNDGKRVEKVVLSKQGNDYVAKRDTEPALYQVDGKTVDELEKAAADVKPAETKPAKK